MNNILTTEFESIKFDLIKKYDEKGMRASGKFADSLEVVMVNESRVQLWGNDYAQQLETGRRAGKFPPLAPIKQWIEDKGIAQRIQGNISVGSLAFLIARKIARQGWDRQEYGGVELISEVITEKRIQKIINQVGASEAIKFSIEITQLINGINNN